jgi:hypothetical protein
MGALERMAESLAKFAKALKGPERCEYCDDEVTMMYMRGSGFCSIRCQEYEYWEEMQDAETESP